MRYREQSLQNSFESGEKLEEATLFVDDGEESKAAEAELAKRGIRYRRVDISVNGLRGWLLFEYGTAKAPILVDGNSVFIGLEEIKKVLR